MVVSPVLPTIEGPSLTGVVPGLLGHLYGSAPLPDWMPAPAAGASQIVLLVLDGLGWEQLGARRALAPTLAEGTGRSDHVGGPQHDRSRAHLVWSRGAPRRITGWSGTGWRTTTRS